MNAVDVATNAKQWYRKMSVRGIFCGRNARSDKDMLAHDRWKRGVGMVWRCLMVAKKNHAAILRKH